MNWHLLPKPMTVIVHDHFSGRCKIRVSCIACGSAHAVYGPEVECTKQGYEALNFCLSGVSSRSVRAGVSITVRRFGIAERIWNTLRKKQLDKLEVARAAQPR
jgi:hypothetical protein